MICGYPASRIGNSGEVVLREISFGMSAADLRDIAGFLLMAAEEIEVRQHHAGWHWHIESHVGDWHRRHPEIDIVVVRAPSG
jgi:hypothetical protein